MLFLIVQMAMFMLSQSKLRSKITFIQNNKLVENPEIHTLCPPDLKLTFFDCCLQSWVQRSCIYCRLFVFRCKSVEETLDSTKIDDFSPFPQKDFVLSYGQENGDIGLQQISTYVSSATDPTPGTSNSDHDWIKRSTFTWDKLLPPVKQEISLIPDDKMSNQRSSFSKRNIIHEIDQLKEFQPLHKQFSSTKDMRSSLKKLDDKNRKHPIGYLNTSMTLTKLNIKDKNSDLIIKLSSDGSNVAINEQVKLVTTDSKSAPIVINPQFYLGTKEYNSRLINDSDRRRKFLSKLHNFMKDKKKLQIQKGCRNSSVPEDIKTVDDQQIKTAEVKDIKTSGCVEHESKGPYNPRSLQLVTTSVESKDTSDDRREKQFNPLLVADDQISVRVQSVGSDETLVKRWGSLGAGKFRRWWFGN